MVWRERKLEGCEAMASDGRVGKLRDVLFDDRTWTLRFFVVDTGHLPGRRVLVSPQAAIAYDARAHRLLLRLTLDEVRHSPSVRSIETLSREEARATYEDYGWEPYWGTPGAMGLGMPALTPPRPRDRRDERGSHLVSGHALGSYVLDALDERFGHIKDLVVDDRDWSIRQLVLDTGDWIPRRKLLLLPESVTGFDTLGRQVHVWLTRAVIEHAPAWDGALPLAPDYEQALRTHFRANRGWTATPLELRRNARAT